MSQIAALKDNPYLIMTTEPDKGGCAINRSFKCIICDKENFSPQQIIYHLEVMLIGYCYN